MGITMKKPCCAILPKILKEFNWFSYTDEDTVEKRFVMPFIETSNGEKWRVNNCPSCGEDIRMINISYDDLYEEEGH
jgi:hypothetical protein